MELDNGTGHHGQDVSTAPPARPVAPMHDPEAFAVYALLRDGSRVRVDPGDMPPAPANAPSTSNPSPDDYLQHGWALAEIKWGTKGGGPIGWNDPNIGVLTQAHKDRLLTLPEKYNLGVFNGASEILVIDIDDYPTAKPYLAEYGIDLDDALTDPDAVRIMGGTPGRAKLLYKRPEGLQPFRYHKLVTGIAPATDENGLPAWNADNTPKMVPVHGIELRGCTVRDDGTVNPYSHHDLLPGSYRKDTNTTVEWAAPDGSPFNARVMPDVWVQFWMTQTLKEMPARSTTQMPKPLAAGKPPGRRDVGKGERDDYLYRRACFYRRQGLEADEMEPVLHRENAEDCNPPLRSEQVREKIVSACKHKPTEVPANEASVEPIVRRRARIGQGLQFDTAKSTTLCGGRYRRKTETLISGNGGSGKSYCLLLHAILKAGGYAPDLQPCEPEKVMFVSLEDDEETLVERADAILDNYMRVQHMVNHPDSDEPPPPPLRDIPGILDRIYLRDATPRIKKGDPLPTRFESPLVREKKTDGESSVFVTPLLQDVYEDAVEFEPGLLIVDNMSDALKGDENNRAVVGPYHGLFLAIAMVLDAAVVMLGHFDKAAVRYGGKARYSGNTANNNKVRERHEMDEEEGASTLVHVKANRGPKLEPLRHEWVEYGVGNRRMPVVVSRERLTAQAAVRAQDELYAVLWAVSKAEAENVDVPINAVGKGSARMVLLPWLPKTLQEAPAKSFRPLWMEARDAGLLTVTHHPAQSGGDRHSKPWLILSDEGRAFLAKGTVL